MSEALEVVVDDYFPVASAENPSPVESETSRLFSVAAAAWRLFGVLLVPREDDASSVPTAAPWMDFVPQLVVSPIGGCGWPLLSPGAMVAASILAVLVLCLVLVHVRFRAYTVELARLEKAFPWRDDEE
jgi:hypothetical protein